MTGADIVIGWVNDDGTAVFHVKYIICTFRKFQDSIQFQMKLIFWYDKYFCASMFQDRHALGEYEPVIDESQDVTLLAANQNDTHTILRFSRPYVTCDENDRDITVSCHN